LNALGLLSADEYSAAKDILPILSQLKRNCIRKNGWNRIFHPPHTIEEGITDIEQSTLGDNHKATLIIAINEIPTSSIGNGLFLPMNSQTKVEKLKKRILHLEES
jgi:hypothetical protein